MDAATGRSRGTGFVCFWNRADADSVIEKSNTIRTDMTGVVGATIVRSCCNRHLPQLS
jgi:nucleolar protein 4